MKSPFHSEHFESTQMGAKIFFYNSQKNEKTVVHSSRHMGVRSGVVGGRGRLCEKMMMQMKQVSAKSRPLRALKPTFGESTFPRCLALAFPRTFPLTPRDALEGERAQSGVSMAVKNAVGCVGETIRSGYHRFLEPATQPLSLPSPAHRFACSARLVSQSTRTGSGMCRFTPRPMRHTIPAKHSSPSPTCAPSHLTFPRPCVTSRPNNHVRISFRRMLTPCLIQP